MVITEVRIKLVEENNERLMAFCSITLDNAFVIRDLKIIEGTRGLFVAMPSRKLTDRCPRCGSKNHLRSRFCNNCGSHLDEGRAPRDHDGRAKLHADIAHPINSMCREIMQQAIVKSFHEEKDRAKLPGYVCRYDDFDGGDFDYDTPATTAASATHETAKPNGYRAHAGHGPGGNSRGTHLRSERATPARLPSDETV
ncbi:SpoVG family protein [Zavarzinella formosa]|uniref:SpoVG family protein n=1 Tax=Zavarzinella formosa TaxID=360055 RepID=UPI0003041E45|nr:SpoVG family protein [Zavarzinella formosa]